MHYYLLRIAFHHKNNEFTENEQKKRAKVSLDSTTQFIDNDDLQILLKNNSLSHVSNAANETAPDLYAFNFRCTVSFE